MRRSVVWMVVLSLAVLAGCGDSPKKKVLGVWKAGRSMLSDVPNFLEITETQVIVNGQKEQAVDIVIEEKDGRAVLRRAGTDDTLMVVSFAEDKTATVESMFLGKQTLIPSTREEMQDTLNPSPEKLLGFWAREAGGEGAAYHDVIEIGKDFIRSGEIEEKVQISSGMGSYFFAGSETLRDRGKLQDKDTLFFGNPLTGTLTLRRVDRETAEKYAAEKARMVEGILGFWLSGEERGAFDPPAYMEITHDAVVRHRDGEEERLAGRLTLSGGEYMIVDAEGKTLIKLERTGPDSIGLARHSFSFGREPSFARASAEQIAEAKRAYDELSALVLGQWRRTSGRDGVDTHPFLEVTPERFHMHGKDEKVTRIYGRRDAVLVETEESKQPYRITFPKEGLIRLDSPSWQESGEYRRSQAQERDTFLGGQAALPDKVTGYWRSVQGDEKTKNFLPLHLTRDTLTWGGGTYKIRIVPKNERSFELIDAATDGKYATVTLQDNGTLHFDPAQFNQRGRYDRSDKEEYEALAAGRTPLPLVYRGYWLAETQEGVAIRHDALLLGEAEIVRNGNPEPVRVDVHVYNIRLMRSDLPNYEIARIQFDYDKRDQLRLSYLVGDIRYRRVGKEEYETALAGCRIDLDSLFTDWVSERIDRKAVPQAAVQFVKGKPGQWPVALNSMGLSVKNDEPQQGVIPGVFDLTGKGTVILRGGDKLTSRLADIAIIDADTISLKEYKFLHKELKYRRRTAAGGQR